MSDWSEAERHVERAHELFEAGQWRDAEKELREALSLNPEALGRALTGGGMEALIGCLVAPGSGLGSEVGEGGEAFGGGLH